MLVPQLLLGNIISNCMICDSEFIHAIVLFFVCFDLCKYYQPCAFLLLLLLLLTTTVFVLRNYDGQVRWDGED